MPELPYHVRLFREFPGQAYKVLDQHLVTIQPEGETALKGFSVWRGPRSARRRLQRAGSSRGWFEDRWRVTDPPTLFDSRGDAAEAALGALQLERELEDLYRKLKATQEAMDTALACKHDPVAEEFVQNLSYAYHNNGTVHYLMRQGAPLDAIIRALVHDIEQMVQKLCIRQSPLSVLASDQQALKDTGA